MPENTPARISGQCLCGEVRFEIHGPARDIVNCHCAKCRRFHGNFGAYTSVKLENLVITVRKRLKWYDSTTDETPNVRRGFCSACGSSLFWHPKDSPTISVAAGALDSPSGLKTIGHIWCSQKADYYQIEDDLPRFEERWRQ